MPIRAIKGKTYNGVKELYSAKTGLVTGYYVQYRNADGVIQKYRVHESTNRDEALLYLNNRKFEVKRAKTDDNAYRMEKKRKRIKLNDLADEYFKVKGDTVDKRVSARYNNHVRSEPIGSLIVNDITLADAEGLKATLATKKMSTTKKGSEAKYGLSEGTINHILAMCKTIIKFGIQNRYCTYNIFDSMNVNRKSQQRMKVLSPSEVDELIENAGYNKRLQMFIQMLYFTAQRPKSILELQRKHIDIVNGHITVARIKGQKATTVPIAKKLLPFLTEWIEDLKPTDFLFHRMAHPQGTGVTDASSKVSFQRMQKSAIKLFELYNEGLNSKEDRLMITSFYTLRHSSATNILQATNDIYLVKEILNHSDIKMTERYAKLADNAKQGGLDAL